jgi:hypothetical protein
LNSSKEEAFEVHLKAPIVLPAMRGERNSKAARRA